MLVFGGSRLVGRCSPLLVERIRTNCSAAGNGLRPIILPVAAATLCDVTDRGLEALRVKWFENLERAEPQQMKTMAEAYILIRQMQAEDTVEKDNDPFRKEM